MATPPPKPSTTAAGHWFKALTAAQRARACALAHQGEFDIADTEDLLLTGANSPYHGFVVPASNGKVRFASEVAAFLLETCPPPTSSETPS